MRPRRGYSLDLLHLHLPVGGWVSILHRASGALLALLVPCLLYALMLSLRSAEDHARLLAFLSGGPGRALGLVVLWAALHHLLAGLRHLGLDIGWGEGRRRARQTAWASLAAAAGLALAIGAGLL